MIVGNKFRLQNFTDMQLLVEQDSLKRLQSLNTWE